MSFETAYLHFCSFPSPFHSSWICLQSRVVPASFLKLVLKSKVVLIQDSSSMLVAQQELRSEVRAENIPELSHDFSSESEC